MRSVPRPLVAASAVAVLAVVALAALVVSRSPGVPARTTGTAAATQGAEAPVAKSLSFTFTDDAIASLPDDTRTDAWTFTVDGQSIGVLELTPGAPGQAAPPSFDAWVQGLDGAISLGGTRIPVTETTIGGYHAIAFDSPDSAETATNVIAEVQGHVLWLQSATDRAPLADFLSKIKTVEKNG